jgi:hypothetical protein
MRDLRITAKSLLPVRALLIIQWFLAVVSFRGTFQMSQLALTIVSRKPRTFQDKILYKMKYDRNPIVKIFADKVLVRDYVLSKVGSDYLTKSFGTYDSIRGIDHTQLPRNIVVKSNHGSGAWVIIWEGAQRGNKIEPKNDKNSWRTYLIHPDDLNWNDLVELTESWMKTNYYWEFGRYPEWAYLDIKPKILIEEVLLYRKELPRDYKFHMVNGECKFIYTVLNRFSGLKIDLYSPDWKKYQAFFHYPSSNEIQQKPCNLDEMMAISSKLSEGIDFVRVDLYDTDQGIRFGELTNYPFGGRFDIKPKKLSLSFAESWKQNY